MKKIVIASILGVLLVLSIIMNPVNSKAETPDLFMMNEIYLYDYDNFNFSPNFENDYLLNTTILPKDVESNISGFIGWYKDLGYWQLLVPYYGDDVDNNHWVYFAVPCYDVLAANFQLAYYAQEPMAIQFGVNFTDGTNQLWDTENNGYGAQLLRISNINIQKNIESFWWSAKTADYVPSFKFLGVTDGYDIGYQNGEGVGYDSGYQVGYNLGFRNGFQDGITQSEDVVIYESVLDFNQIVNPANLQNINSINDVTFTNNNDGSYTLNGIANAYTRVTFTTITQDMQITGHKYLVIGGSNKVTIRFSGVIGNIDTNQKYYIYTGDSSNYVNGSLQFIIYADTNVNDYYIKPNIIDLTKMYGDGREPTLEECQVIFAASQYDFTTGEPVQMGYYTGYYDGENIGISKGIDIGESNQISMGWIQSIFAAIQGVLSIQIFPKVTIGIIVGIPFVISLAWFVIKMFRGGGGGE